MDFKLTPVSGVTAIDDGANGSLPTRLTGATAESTSREE